MSDEGNGENGLTSPLTAPMSEESIERGRSLIEDHKWSPYRANVVACVPLKLWEVVRVLDQLERAGHPDDHRFAEEMMDIEDKLMAAFGDAYFADLDADHTKETA